MEQTNLFDFLYPTYKIENQLKLIEAFGGYGSQLLAIKYLGLDYKKIHHKLIEWCVPSIQAYKDVHFPGNNTDYSIALYDEQVFDVLLTYGISNDYNKPMTQEEIHRKGIKWARNVYNNIIATQNLVNISRVKGSDLEISDSGKYTYLFCYSFPCQDLSLR